MRVSDLQSIAAFLILLFLNSPESRAGDFNMVVQEQQANGVNKPVSGGPCTYTGDTMLQVHGGMDATEAQFNAIVEDLVNAMNTLQVPLTAQNQLLALLAPMYSDIAYQ